MTPRVANLPNRQSCDRCHGHKLCCTRQSGPTETGTCSRCLRQGAECVYSSTLPRGRHTAQASGQASSHSSGHIGQGPSRPVPIAAPAQIDPTFYPYPLATATTAPHAAQKNRSNSSAIIDDAALGSVVTSLVSADASSQSPPSTISNALQGTLSASQHLLSILCRLQDGAVATKSSSSTVSTSTLANTGAHVDPWGTFTPQPPSTSRSNLPEHSGGGNGPSNFYEPRQALNGSMMADSAAGQGRHFGMVVHHLVLACHTLLLNTYGTLLAALQHDADLQRDSLLPGAGGNASKEEGEADAAILSDMRLALVVQLSSYFIDRLHQAVDAYMPFYNQYGGEQLRGMPSPLSPPSLSSSRHHNRKRSMDSSASSTADRGAIDDLEMEVRQRLIRLRQTLRI